MSRSGDYKRDGYKAFDASQDGHDAATRRRVPLYNVDDFVRGWREAAADAAENAARTDQETFLWDLATRLNIARSDLDRLIEIARAA